MGSTIWAMASDLLCNSKGKDMNKWLTELAAALLRHAVPLLLGGLLTAVAAAGWLESERAQLARCVLVDPQPKTCVSRLSASLPLLPLALWRAGLS